MDRHAGVIDRNVPAIAGDVPVKLVEIGVKRDLAVGPVGQAIGIFALGQIVILLTDIDPYAVRLILGEPVLRPAVAQNLDDLEPDDMGLAAAPFVNSGEVAVDAAFNVVPFCPHLNGFGYRQLAIGGDRDVAVEGDDTLFRQGVGRQARQHGAEAENTKQTSHR